MQCVLRVAAEIDRVRVRSERFVFWRDPGQRCHFARSVQWAVASSPQCVGCKRNVDPPEECESLGAIGDENYLPEKKEIFLKGQKTKTRMAVGDMAFMREFMSSVLLLSVAL